jgi:hypothetical protein
MREDRDSGDYAGANEHRHERHEKTLHRFLSGITSRLVGSG